MSEKLVNKGYNGWAQLGILMGMCGVGIILAGIASLASWSVITGRSPMTMEADIMNPSYAGAFKMIQFVSTLFIFFLPALAWAFICYRNGMTALGFQNSANIKIAGICILILAASLPLIDWLSVVNKAIPLPATSRKYFEEIEKSYDDQVKVIGNVKTGGQYVLSMLLIALLPAIFEEAFFRGTIQNLLSRWKNNSIIYVIMVALLLVAVKIIWFPGINSWFFYGALLVIVMLVFRSHNLTDSLSRVTNHYLFPIVLTSILFSAVHASWYGFIPRFVLGMILGLVFYRTNNILYNMVIHFINNAVVITMMYVYAMQNKPVANTDEQGFPSWAAIVSVVILFLLAKLLAKQKLEARPVEVFEDRNNPFNNTIFEDNNKEEL